MAGSTDERSRTASLASSGLDQTVASACKGDAAAFRLLYREFQPLLLRYLRFLAGDRADDVAERAWQRAGEALPARWGIRYGGYDAFRGRLARIARDIAHEEPGRAPAAGYDPAGQDDATGAALRLIAELPAEEAEAVLLRSVLGLDARRAARVTGQRPRELRAAAERGLITLAGRL